MPSSNFNNRKIYITYLNADNIVSRIFFLLGVTRFIFRGRYCISIVVYRYFYVLASGRLYQCSGRCQERSRTSMREKGKKKKRKELRTY